MASRHSSVIYAKIPDEFRVLEYALRPAFLNKMPSDREAEVLLIIVRYSLSNKQIARLLYIDESTVRCHLYKLYCMFDVQDRTELVAKILLWEGWYVQYEGTWRFFSPIWAQRCDPAPFAAENEKEL